MKIQEVLWAVFFTVLFGVIIGIFLFMTPMVLFLGYENTSALGIHCCLWGMPTYWALALTRNYFKKK
jgi:hypothetical protein